MRNPVTYPAVPVNAKLVYSDPDYMEPPSTAVSTPCILQSYTSRFSNHPKKMYARFIRHHDSIPSNSHSPKHIRRSVRCRTGDWQPRTRKANASDSENRKRASEFANQAEKTCESIDQLSLSIIKTKRRHIKTANRTVAHAIIATSKYQLNHNYKNKSFIVFLIG